MFTRCTFCHRELPANETLEHFPVGRRVAFDPARGRLWAVCPACRRWNLAPIEERWEALEELEKLTRDRARLLSQTDNIALLRSGELEIVRVGRANLTEEAWWRYGVELVRRRRQYQILTAAGVAGVMGLMAGGAAAGIGVFGGWWVIGRIGRQLPRLSRRLKFGTTAWRGRAVCPRCGNELVRIPFQLRGALLTRPDGDEGVALALRCPVCDYGREAGRVGVGERLELAGAGMRDFRAGQRARRRRRRAQESWGAAGRGELPGLARELRPPVAPAAGTGESGFLITGVEAEHLFRRVLAYQNFAGAREPQIRAATTLIQSAGSAPSLARQVAGTGRRLSSVAPTEAIALEIAVNEDRERRLLELELAALEARWREEEEIAAIVDGELTWIPGAPLAAPGDDRPGSSGTRAEPF